MHQQPGKRQHNANINIADVQINWLVQLRFTCLVRMSLRQWWGHGSAKQKKLGHYFVALTICPDRVFGYVDTATHT